MSSLFIVGTINHQNYLNEREGKGLSKLTVVPEKICFYSYDLQKVNISKVSIKNQTSNKIVFKVNQPKKTALQVKYKKNYLNPKQSMQMFVFFNAQKQKIIIDDQIVIQLQKEKTKIHIPIVCKYNNFRLSHTTNSLHHKRILKPIQNNQGFTSKHRIVLAKKRKSSLINSITSIGKMIDNFMQKYAHIHDFIKQKNVKKQIFIGEKALTWENQSKIIEFNLNIKKIIFQKFKNILETRYQSQFSQESPVIQNIQGQIVKWDEKKNISKIVYNKAVAKIQQEIRKYIVNLRFQKIHRIFSIYREFENQQQNSHLPLHKRHQFYVQKLQKKLHKSSEQSLELIFDKSSVKPKYLDTQFDNQYLKIGFTFQINPRIGFDNWIAIQQSISYNHEAMGYTKKVALPDWSCYPKLDQKLTKRDKNLQLLRQEVDDYELKQFFKGLSTKIYEEQLFVSLDNEINSHKYLKFKTYQKISDPFEEVYQNNQLYEKNYLKHDRNALDQLNCMTIFKQDFEPYQSADNIYLVEQLLDYKLDIKHKPEKQDSNEFSQNDPKIKKVLNLIQFNNKRNDFKHGKIKGVDFDAALKNKMRNNISSQVILQNLSNVKQNQLIMAQSKIKNWQTFSNNKKFQLFF